MNDEYYFCFHWKRGKAVWVHACMYVMRPGSSPGVLHFAALELAQFLFAEEQEEEKRSLQEALTTFCGLHFLRNQRGLCSGAVEGKKDSGGKKVFCSQPGRVSPSSRANP